MQLLVTSVAIIEFCVMLEEVQRTPLQALIDALTFSSLQIAPKLAAASLLTSTLL